MCKAIVIEEMFNKYLNSEVVTLKVYIDQNEYEIISIEVDQQKPSNLTVKYQYYQWHKYVDCTLNDIWIDYDFTLHGDYTGSPINRSNFLFIEDYLENLTITDKDSYLLSLLCQAHLSYSTQYYYSKFNCLFSETIQNWIDQIEDYPLLSDDHHSEMEYNDLANSINDLCLDIDPIIDSDLITDEIIDQCKDELISIASNDGDLESYSDNCFYYYSEDQASVAINKFFETNQKELNDLVISAIIDFIKSKV